MYNSTKITSIYKLINYLNSDLCIRVETKWTNIWMVDYFLALNHTDSYYLWFLEKKFFIIINECVYTQLRLRTMISNTSWIIITRVFIHLNLNMFCSITHTCTKTNWAWPFSHSVIGNTFLHNHHYNTTVHRQNS